MIVSRVRVVTPRAPANPAPPRQWPRRRPRLPQHVAAPEEHGADLGEHGEQRPQTERGHGRRDAGRTSGDLTDLRHPRERPRRQGARRRRGLERWRGIAAWGDASACMFRT